MNLKECIKSAVAQLLSNKMRTLLTMLGMFIGIGAVIMVLSVGQGVKTMMLGTFEDVGKGTVQIRAKNYSMEYMLTQEDLDAISEMPEVREAIFMDTGYNTVLQDYKKEEKYGVVAGIPYNFDMVQALNIVEGRNFTKREDLGKAKVVIVSETYAKAILGSDDKKSVIGRTVELKIKGQTQEFEIVGLVEAMTFPGMPEEMMPLIFYIPFGTMDQILNFGDFRSYEGAFMVEEGYDPNEIAYQVGRLLDKRHKTENGYQVSSAMSMISQMDSVMSIVTGFISFVAAISLLVGGIGIMNIMLVTVKERTREIGVRKALGATNREILRQFLIEAIILTVFGGMIGLILGYLGGAGIGSAFGLDVTLTWGMVIFAVGTSSAIGIIFGVYPAKQASKLEPVEALRYE
ncbi:MAG: ABC transporter permease [Cellulosilyticaceae bacterium]